MHANRLGLPSLLLTTLRSTSTAAPSAALQDNDGCITTAELGTVMRALGKNPTEAEIRLLAKEVDPDGRGTVNLQGALLFACAAAAAAGLAVVSACVYRVCSSNACWVSHWRRTLKTRNANTSKHQNIETRQHKQCQTAEFLGVMGRDIRSYDSEADIRAAWKVFDKEGRGWIAAAELRHVLTSIGEKLAADEVDAMMAESDPDQDGKVQYEEFIRMLTAR